MSRVDSGTQQGGSATDQLKETAAQVQQNVRDAGTQVRDAAEEKFNELRDQASQYYDQGREAAKEWEQGLEDYVQAQPLKALLIAAGVGALVGFFWRR